MNEFTLEKYLRLMLTCDNVQQAVENGANIPHNVYSNLIRKKNNAVKIAVQNGSMF